MAGNGIYFSGLASGLDTRAIIDQLVALERLPIQQIEIQKEVQTSKLDLIGSLEGLVDKLEDAAAALSTTDKFYSYTVGMSFDGVATISASSTAQAGTHTLEVLNTAAIDRWAFDGVSDDEADLATADGQSISFDVDGTTYTATLDQDASNIHEIAAALEDAVDGAVHVSVVNTGTDSSPSYQLVMASAKSGEDYQITNITNTIAGLSIDTASGSDNHLSTGTNAVALIDGLEIQRSDNDFSDVIEGVSIDLLSSNEGDEMTFTVESDRSAIRGRIDNFVKAYNAVIDFINGQSKYSEEDGVSGDLFGDAILRQVRDAIRSPLFDVDLDTISDDTLGFSTLSLVGIKQDRDGKLSVDSAKLDEKMGENLALLADLFVDTDGFERVSDVPNTEGYFQDATADSGLADKLQRAIERITSSQQGPVVDDDSGQRLVLPSLFNSRKNAIKENVKRYDKRIEDQERRLEAFEEGLIRRFASLEQLMGELNARGAALSGALAGLTKK